MRPAPINATRAMRVPPCRPAFRRACRRFCRQLPSPGTTPVSSGFAAGGGRHGESVGEGIMELGIKRLRVLVTAGAGGIGREIARAFTAEGAKVHVCDVDERALQALKKSDRKITQTRADVADRNDVARLFAEAVKALGGLDVLVNNA